MPPPEIARKMSEVWLRPDWEVVARRKGQQCTRPCGKETPCEDTPSNVSAERSKNTEVLLSRQSPCSTLLTPERLIQLLELALTALSSQQNATDCSR